MAEHPVTGCTSNPLLAAPAQPPPPGSSGPPPRRRPPAPCTGPPWVPQGNQCTLRNKVDWSKSRKIVLLLGCVPLKITSFGFAQWTLVTIGSAKCSRRHPGEHRPLPPGPHGGGWRGPGPAPGWSCPPRGGPSPPAAWSATQGNTPKAIYPWGPVLQDELVPGLLNFDVNSACQFFSYKWHFLA